MSFWAIPTRWSNLLVVDWVSCILIFFEILFFEDFDIKSTKRTFVGKDWPKEDNNNEHVKVVSGQYCTDPNSSLTYFYSE